MGDGAEDDPLGFVQRLVEGDVADKVALLVADLELFDRFVEEGVVVGGSRIGDAGAPDVCEDGTGWLSLAARVVDS